MTPALDATQERGRKDMSTGTKRTLADAKRDAEMFRALFADCYERWEVAGSVRRGKALVGDVEHVVIPKHGDVTEQNGLFSQTRTVNLMLHRREALLVTATISKHLYTSNHADGSTSVSPRWGETYWGSDFRGFNHEIFCAVPANWGAQLLIRTGPADFSRRVVDTLRLAGTFRQQDGLLHYVANGSTVDVPDEETYLSLAGMKWVEPSARV